MNIVKSRGGMTAMLAVMALASTSVFAQAPGGGPPRGPGGGGPGGGGFGGPADVPTLMQRQGLTDPALKLTDAQKASLEKLLAANIENTKALDAKYPRVQGAAPNPEAQAARTKLREELTAAVGKVLDDSQRKTLEAAQAARRAQMGGPGGPGGGPGGPGGPPPAR